MYHFYILYSSSADKYYIGHTSNLEERVKNTIRTIPVLQVKKRQGVALKKIQEIARRIPFYTRATAFKNVKTKTVHELHEPTKEFTEGNFHEKTIKISVNPPAAPVA